MATNSQPVKNADGSTTQVNADGSTTTYFPNGDTSQTIKNPDQTTTTSTFLGNSGDNGAPGSTQVIQKNSAGAVTASTKTQQNQDGSTVQIKQIVDQNGNVGTTQTTTSQDKNGNTIKDVTYSNPGYANSGYERQTLTRPDGTSDTQDSHFPGLTTHLNANGKPVGPDGKPVQEGMDQNALSGTTDANGKQLTWGQVNAANNAANGTIGNGGFFGLGGNPVAGTIDAARALAIKVVKTGNEDWNAATGAPLIGGGTGGAGGGTAGTAAAIAAAAALRDKASAAYDVSKPGTAPTITATAAKDPTLVSYLAQAPTTSATASQVGDVPQVTAPTIGAAPTVTAGQATAQQLDTGPQSEFRGTQQNLVGYLNDAITGKAPSVAELQLREAEQRQEANQLGIAAAASRGGNTALALRTAANNIGRLNQASSADAALTRAQEIATARGQLGTVADQARGIDVTIAGQNAALGTGVSQSNAALLTQASTASANNITSLMQTKAQLEYQASHDNAGNALSAEETNAKLATDTALAAALAKNTADLQSQRLSEEASATNATNTKDTNISNAGFLNTAATNNAANQLTQQQIDEKAKQDAAANALTASGQTITGETDLAKAQAAAAAAAWNKTKDLAGGLASGIAAYETGGLSKAVTNGGGGGGTTSSGGADTSDQTTLTPDFGDDTTPSDRRLKTDIADGSRGAQALMDHLSARTYRFKDGGKGPGERPGERTGIMTDDLEKTPAGKSLVVNTPRGKAIDTVPATGTVMAMLATLNKRLNQMEGRRV